MQDFCRLNFAGQNFKLYSIPPPQGLRSKQRVDGGIAFSTSNFDPTVVLTFLSPIRGQNIAIILKHQNLFSNLSCTVPAINLKQFPSFKFLLPVKIELQKWDFNFLCLKMTFISKWPHFSGLHWVFWTLEKTQTLICRKTSYSVFSKNASFSLQAI